MCGGGYQSCRPVPSLPSPLSPGQPGHSISTSAEKGSSWTAGHPTTPPAMQVPSSPFPAFQEVLSAV